MFDIAWGEFIVIAVVALIVIGPKELPAVLRAIGQWTTKIRRMASEFQGQFQEALREAEMADLKKEVDSLNDAAKDAAKGFTSQFDDPLNFKEATKWEPKPDDAKPNDVAKSDDAKSDDAPPQSAPVTPEGYVAPEPVTDTPAPEAVGVAAGQPEIKPPTLPSPAGGGGKGGGAVDAASPPPAKPPAAQSALLEGSGQGGGEGGVHP
jgi:sec-independent protein translocase protein TatB